VLGVEADCWESPLRSQSQSGTSDFGDGAEATNGGEKQSTFTSRYRRELFGPHDFPET